MHIAERIICVVRWAVVRTTEAPADKCSSDEFTCGDGTCIPLSQRCDWTEYHCPDGTDEFDCRTLSLNCLAIQYTFNSNYFHIAFLLPTFFFVVCVNTMKLLIRLHWLYVDSGSNKTSTQRVHSWWVQMRRRNVHWTEISLWPWISLSWRHRRDQLPYVPLPHCTVFILIQMFHIQNQTVLEYMARSNGVYVCVDDVDIANSLSR